MKKKNRRTPRLVIFALVVLAAAGGAYWYFIGSSGAPGADGNAAGSEVTMIRPREGVVAVEIDAPALIRPLREVTLRSSSGGTILEVAAEGQRVRTGDVVVRLDPADLDRQVQRTRIDLEEAQLAYERALRTAERARVDLADIETLHTAGGASGEQLANSRDAVITAEHTVTLTNLAMERARLNLTNAEAARAAATIRAPWDGVVLATLVQPSDSVGTNAALVTVGQLDSVLVTAEIDEYDVARVSPGMATTVRVDAVSGTGAGPFTGVVERISPTAQVVSNISVFTLSTIVDNPRMVLRPGMSADLLVSVSRDEGLVIPVTAVTTVRNRSYVDVRLREPEDSPDDEAAPESDVETVRVTLGASDGVNVVVVEGLTADDRVIMPVQAGFTIPTTAGAPAAPTGSIVPMSVPGSGAGASGGGGGGGR